MTTQPTQPKPSEAPKAASDAATETVVEEQRKRSDEIEAMGVEAWKAAHDDRAHTDQQPKTVAGVTKTATVEVHVKGH